MKKSSIAVVAAATAMFFGASAGGAWAADTHYLGTDSVDGRDIRYEDGTKWDDARTWAEARWEELPEDVELLKDTALTNADLQMSDYNEVTNTAAYWQPRVGADTLKFNDYWYNGYSTADRRNTTVHEFGHAFGISDHYEDQYNNTVMDSCPSEACGAAYDRPQTHDKADFTHLWK